MMELFLSVVCELQDIIDLRTEEAVYKTIVRVDNEAIRRGRIILGLPQNRKKIDVVKTFLLSVDKKDTIARVRRKRGLTNDWNVFERVALEMVMESGN